MKQILSAGWTQFCKGWWEGACALFWAGYAFLMAAFVSGMFAVLVTLVLRIFSSSAQKYSSDVFWLSMLATVPYYLGKFFNETGRIPMSEIEREAIRRAVAKKLLFPKLSGSKEPPV